MDQKLHRLFEQALADELAAPPGDLAQVAMAEGTRLRRRRRLVAGGSAAGVLAVFATIVAVTAGAPADNTPPVTAGVAALTKCAPPAPDAPVEATVILRVDITARQRAEVDTALRSDPAVSQVTRKTREDAFEKFKNLWRDNPDFVASLSRHWEDLSVETVAEIVGVSTSVVKMQSARSLSRLRQLLGEDFIMS